jgi:hypothetical protein|tara:strand:- start:254 stop:496 length:243 start_codon:yes stop_codon:yes gene_type:complete
MTPTEQLTEIIRQILDTATHLTDINMASEAGRQVVAASIASQMIDSPDMIVVDVLNSTDEERHAVDAAFEADTIDDTSSD